jgi:hypothetical protein
MTALAQKPMTAEEFAAWAEARPEKHWELFDGVPQMQQSQTWGHQEAVMAPYRLFYAAIRDAGLPLFVGAQGITVKADGRTALSETDIELCRPQSIANTITPRNAVPAALSTRYRVAKSFACPPKRRPTSPAPISLKAAPNMGITPSTYEKGCD